MKHLLFKGMLTVCFLLVPVLGYCEEISKAFMHEDESGEVIFIDKKTSQQRSKESFSTNRISQDGRVIYKFVAHGEGNYDKYENVSWEVEAEMEEKENLIYPIHSIRIIKNKDTGNIVIKYENRFDYDNKKIDYTTSDGEGNIIKKKKLDTEGITVDSATMTHILKTFLAHSEEKAYKTFYLLSADGKIYKTTIKVMGSEMLELPVGKIKAIKLRLIPNLGLLTGVAGIIVPPTFVWYTEQEPYEWLQYEGLETSLGSSHIVAYISKREPPLK